MSQGVSQRLGRENLYSFVTGSPLDPESGMYGSTCRVELIRRVVAERPLRHSSTERGSPGRNRRHAVRKAFTYLCDKRKLTKETSLGVE